MYFIEHIYKNYRERERKKRERGKERENTEEEIESQVFLHRLIKNKMIQKKESIQNCITE
jgi:siroheme synthase (precorrin-2 oxidase/ferrochelatase)